MDEVVIPASFPLPPPGRFLKMAPANVPVIKALIFSPAGAEDKRLGKNEGEKEYALLEYVKKKQNLFIKLFKSLAAGVIPVKIKLISTNVSPNFGIKPRRTRSALRAAQRRGITQAVTYG